MKQLFRQHNLYTLLWCLYFLQGTLYAEGSILSRAILLVFIMFSLYYFIVSNQQYKLPKLLKILNVLVILFGVYGLLRIIIGTDQSWKWVNESTTFLKEYELSILPVYAFYYFGRKNLIDDKWFFNVAFIFLSVALLGFRRENLIRLQSAYGSGVTNNSGYMVLSLFPIVLFMKKNTILQYVFATTIFLFVLLSMKRGAIIIGSVTFLCLLYNLLATAKKGKKKFFIIIFSFIAISVAVNVVGNMLATNDYFNTRLQKTLEGDMSGREDMYPMYFSYFKNEMNLFPFLFGNGADGTLKIYGNFAHNDWLEIAIDLGLLGIIIYFAYLLSFYKTWKMSRRRLCSEYSLAIAIIFFICFARSFFSMSINGMPLYLTSVLGYCLAQFSMSKSKIDIYKFK